LTANRFAGPDPRGLPFGLAEAATSPRAAWDAAMYASGPGPQTIERGVPMRDGIELATDIHLPPAAELPAPAIVLGTPYDKQSPCDDMRPYRDAGYATVVYDVRGRGKSEGVCHPFALDGPDGHDVVEWVSQQPWCTGAVGVSGLSYSAWVVWATIKEKPRALRAAVSTSPAGRWQEELPYTYGCFWLYFAAWFAGTGRRINGNRSVPELLEMLPVSAIGEALEPVGPGWQEMMDHDTLDELWRSRRWDGEYDFEVPVLHVTGWHDREDIWGAFHHYEQMMATSPARDQQWLLVGPWSHVSSRHPSDTYMGIAAPGARLDMNAIHARFFDRFLKGEDNGVDEEPRVQMYDPGRRRWCTREGWQTGTVPREFFLAAGEGLAFEAGAAGSTEYRYDPMQPNGNPFDVNRLWEPPLDLAELESQEGVVTWTSQPLEEDLTVHGWGEVELWAATDGDDTEWHAKLADVSPEGQSLFVAWGCLRASYGADASNPAPVIPDEPARYSVELTPSFHTFKAGHRVRLVLASSEFPWFARNMNRFGPIAGQDDPRVATNIIFYGARRPSCLRLPVDSSSR
jgi:putative CocE/NonD family hydrolase